MERRPPCLNTGHRRGSLLRGARKSRPAWGPFRRDPKGLIDQEGKIGGEGKEAEAPRPSCWDNDSRARPPPPEGGRQTRGPACERASHVREKCSKRPVHRQRRHAVEPLRRARGRLSGRCLRVWRAGGAAGRPLRTTIPFSRVDGTRGKAAAGPTPPRSLRRSTAPAAATGHRALPAPRGPSYPGGNRRPRRRRLASCRHRVPSTLRLGGTGPSPESLEALHILGQR